MDSGNGGVIWPHVEWTCGNRVQRDENTYWPYGSRFLPAGEIHCFHNVGDDPVTMLFIQDAGEVTRTFAEKAARPIDLLEAVMPA